MGVNEGTVQVACDSHLLCCFYGYPMYGGKLEIRVVSVNICGGL